MYNLKPTQIEVLRILADHRDQKMGAYDIKKYTSMNVANISNAIRFLANKDLVYQPDIQGKVQISSEGLEELQSYY